MTATFDRPWRRLGRAAYARARLRTLLKPPVTVVAAPADLHKIHDAPLPMRDGVVLRVNVYLPAGDGVFPVVLSAHPYGKDNVPKKTRNGWKLNPQFHIMNQSQPFTISSETGWEAPDPVWWTSHGYAVINADLRGAGTSEGVGSLFSQQEADDIHDLIEWAGAQSWSTGRVGMLGVSYLAISQYRAAGLNPPSLAAICPWEGFTDPYRDFLTPGGVEETGFSRIWFALSKRVARLSPDLSATRKEHPLRDDWWRAITPDLAAIRVPMLVCASFSDANLHSRGSWRAFTEVSSADRFVYSHRGPKWSTFYSEEALAAQLAFFDRFVAERVDAPALPPVRLEVRDRGHVVHAVREEQEWPLARTTYREIPLSGTISFGLRRGAVGITTTFDEDTEVTGVIRLRLRASLTRDANLLVGAEKWSAGVSVPFEGSYGYGRDRIALGWRRAGVVAAGFDRVEPVASSAPLDLEIELTESSTFFHAGESLRLLISGRSLEPGNLLFGHFPARYRRNRGGRATLHLDESTLVLPVVPPSVE